VEESHHSFGLLLTGEFSWKIHAPYDEKAKL